MEMLFLFWTRRLVDILLICPNLPSVLVELIVLKDFAMQIVSSYNEWDPLEEVIVGVSDNACFAYDEPANIVLMSPDEAPMYTPGSRSAVSINKARTQLDNLCRVLQQHCNVKVLRPEKIDFTQPVQTPYFSIKSQNCATCPRDTLLVVGNEIVESTMSHRSRYFEAMAYRKLLNDIWEKDANMLWTMAPKPTMADSMYHTDFPWNNKQERTNWMHSYRYVTNETEPVFDAADVLRLGKDLFVQHGFTTNRKGIEWLRRHTKSRGYRVHEIHFPDDLWPFHIDCTLTAVVPPTRERKGILLSNPERPIHEAEIRKLFKGSNWDIQNTPEPNIKEVPHECQSSYWLSMNVLMVSPDVAIVEETETNMINYFESLGIKCIRVPFRDVYSFGGAIHCATNDIRRRGECLNYFPNLDENIN